ncbi:hypothetical protein GCM10020367_29090 [Streptomyces sannanensis]|uniref:Protein kinase domain-containing protein n=1 Tax=Streptomyces sannanensis TaxID=285536 RepID=A0ABP6SBN4_9ACTN
MDDLRPGDPQQIGAYRLLRRLGTGGMGQVYLARSGGGRTVVVKVVRGELADQPEFRRRFRQEVAAARRVGGTWTAPVLDADTEAAAPWVATGYIAGPSLQDVVDDEQYGPLREHSALVLANGLLQALADIHRAGLVHRDLKPSNILVTLDGPRVIDFGIARALEPVADALATRTGAVVGSPGFMSPEQVRGERVGTATDVFCLGAVLAYCATGRMPFGGAESGIHALLFRIAQEEPDLAGLPEGPLRALITACLAKDPAARPAVTELLRHTASYAQHSGTWLPAGLTAHLGRHAARLLDTDAPAQETTMPAGRFGPAPLPHVPVGFTPAPAPTPVPVPVPAPASRLKSPKALSNALVTLLCVSSLCSVVDLNYAVGLYRRLSDAARLPAPASAARFEELKKTWQDAPDWVMLTWTLIMLTIFVVWLFWFRRVRINAEAFAPQQHRFSRGWAMFCWFIPIAHLWIPKQITNDIWNASAPHEADREEDTRSRRVLHAWWLLYAANMALIYVSKTWVYWDEAEDTAAARLVALVTLANAALYLGAAVLAIVVVQQLTAMQQRRIDHHVPVGHAGTPVPQWGHMTAPGGH